MTERFPILENPELARLEERFEHQGKLQYVTMPETELYDGPVLLVFRKHNLDSIVAAPGTHIGAEDDGTELDSWRLQQARPPHGTERETHKTSLLAIVTALPGEIADWAVKTHADVISKYRAAQATTLGSYNSRVVIGQLEAELSQAEEEMRLLSPMNPVKISTIANGAMNKLVTVISRDEQSTTGESLGTHYLEPFVTIKIEPSGLHEVSSVLNIPRRNIHNILPAQDLRQH